MYNKLYTEQSKLSPEYWDTSPQYCCWSKNAFTTMKETTVPVQ